MVVRFSVNKRGKYKYTLSQDYIYTLALSSYWREEVDFYVKTKFLHIENGTLTIKKGYSWDGATLAPDLESVLIPSAIHDALLQGAEVVGWGDIDRKMIDAEFHRKMVIDGTPLLVRITYTTGVLFWTNIWKVLRKVGLK